VKNHRFSSLFLPPPTDFVSPSLTGKASAPAVADVLLINHVQVSNQWCYSLTSINNLRMAFNLLEDEEALQDLLSVILGLRLLKKEGGTLRPETSLRKNSKDLTLYRVNDHVLSKKMIKPTGPIELVPTVFSRMGAFLNDSE